MTYILPLVVADLNPYLGLHQGDPNVLRISQDLHRLDVFRIRSVVMDYGFLNAAICRFVKHLYNTCEYNSWTITDRNALINHVLRLCPDNVDNGVAVTVGPTSSGPNLPGNGPINPDLGHGPSRVGPNDPGTSHIKRPSRGKQATPSAGKGQSSGVKGKGHTNAGA